MVQAAGKLTGDWGVKYLPRRDHRPRPQMGRGWLEALAPSFTRGLARPKGVRRGSPSNQNLPCKRVLPYAVGKSCSPRHQSACSTTLTSAGGKDAYRVPPPGMERYPAGQGRNNNTNGAHAWSAGAARRVCTPPAVWVDFGAGAWYHSRIRREQPA